MVQGHKDGVKLERSYPRLMWTSRSWLTVFNRGRFFSRFSQQVLKEISEVIISTKIRLQFCHLV